MSLVANAGSDHEFEAGDVPVSAITLTAGASDLGAGSSVTGAEWVIISQPPSGGASLGAPSSLSTSFGPFNQIGDYVVALVITNDEDEVSEDVYELMPDSAVVVVRVLTANAELALPAKKEKGVWALLNSWLVLVDTIFKRLMDIWVSTGTIKAAAINEFVEDDGTDINGQYIGTDGITVDGYVNVGGAVYATSVTAATFTGGDLTADDILADTVTTPSLGVGSDSYAAGVNNIVITSGGLNGALDVEMLLQYNGSLASQRSQVLLKSGFVVVRGDPIGGGTDLKVDKIAKDAAGVLSIESSSFNGSNANIPGTATVGAIAYDGADPPAIQGSLPVMFWGKRVTKADFAAGSGPKTYLMPAIHATKSIEILSVSIESEAYAAATGLTGCALHVGDDDTGEDNTYVDAYEVSAAAASFAVHGANGSAMAGSRGFPNILGPGNKLRFILDPTGASIEDFTAGSWVIRVRYSIWQDPT